MSGIIGHGTNSRIVGSTGTQVEMFYELRRPNESNPTEMRNGYQTSGSLENPSSTDVASAWCSGAPPRHWVGCKDINFWFNMDQRQTGIPPIVKWRWNISTHDSANDAYDSSSFVLYSTGSVPVSAAEDLWSTNGMGLVGNSRKFEETLHTYDRPFFQISVHNDTNSGISALGVLILWEI
tara:strand:- start:81 stop:620 length:540 start_codon:yes stop_codon:yes gene_type:complete